MNNTRKYNPAPGKIVHQIAQPFISQCSQQFSVTLRPAELAQRVMYVSLQIFLTEINRARGVELMVGLASDVSGTRKPNPRLFDQPEPKKRFLNLTQPEPEKKKSKIRRVFGLKT